MGVRHFVDMTILRFDLGHLWPRSQAGSVDKVEIYETDHPMFFTLLLFHANRTMHS